MKIVKNLYTTNNIITDINPVINKLKLCLVDLFNEISYHRRLYL